ncbi:MAG TPA: SDR family NAD(P)-dependent oxidoreductase [Streptosporangiaceae bacterium]|nr:SDR family NAD(P)-dependent oxidoreductase [Streptosporangiaceae bacterium]
MRIGQRVAVVTGGASGIGRSLCLALAEAGAEAVVVADVDGEGAAAVAATIEAGGHRALAVTADVARPADVEALVAAAQDAFGRIDLLCSNAGIIVGGGVEVTDEAWSRIWAINVQSHVYLARAVLPGMLARGEGYLVYTASAAGLLTQLGSAPYAVTKHAVVALAEWLSITYGDQGIAVSCLCPQAVSTNLGATSLREVGHGGTPATWSERGASAQAAVDGVLTADEVAACVIEAIADERFLILPHPEVATYERRRAEDRERWLRGMRRLQAQLSEGR